MKKQAAALFIGRFQPTHRGHQWLFEQKLKEGKPILIAIRDIEPDEKNPLDPEQVKSLWEKVYEGNELVSVMIIPDIESVNWGRGVGYSPIEHVPPTDIYNISATQIREHIKNGSDEWKTMVDPKVHEDIFQLLKPKMTKKEFLDFLNHKMNDAGVMTAYWSKTVLNSDDYWNLYKPGIDWLSDDMNLEKEGVVKITYDKTLYVEDTSKTVEFTYEEFIKLYDNITHR